MDFHTILPAQFEGEGSVGGGQGDSEGNEGDFDGGRVREACQAPEEAQPHHDGLGSFRGLSEGAPGPGVQVGVRDIQRVGGDHLFVHDGLLWRDGAGVCGPEALVLSPSSHPSVPLWD